MTKAKIIETIKAAFIRNGCFFDKKKLIMSIKSHNS
jgi:hypothetical protein